jgi:hypothetical protein
VNAGAALDAKTQAVFRSVWLEGLSDLSPEVLRAAFQKTLRETVFWPVKVADIRKHVSHAESNATDEAGEVAWQRVLDIRRRLWNPDIPAPFDRALAAMSERIRQAARAAGVFRDFTASEWESGSLHTWAKKRFLESFAAFSEREQDMHLLPDGEIKDLLADLAEIKALPAPREDFSDLPTRGLEYSAMLKQGIPAMSPEARLLAADHLADAARQVIVQANAKKSTVTVLDGDREAFRKQAERIKALYPESKTTDPILLQFISPSPETAQLS